MIRSIRELAFGRWTLMIASACAAIVLASGLTIVDNRPAATVAASSDAAVKSDPLPLHLSSNYPVVNARDRSDRLAQPSISAPATRRTVQLTVKPIPKPADIARKIAVSEKRVKAPVQLSALEPVLGEPMQLVPELAPTKMAAASMAKRNPISAPINSSLGGPAAASRAVSGIAGRAAGALGL